MDRPRRIQGVCLIAAVAAHALLLLAIGHGSTRQPPRPTPWPSARVTTLWLAASPSIAAPAAAVTPAATKPKPRPATVSRVHRAEATAVAPAPAQATEPIRGDVFGLPTLDLGGRARGARPRDDVPTPVVMPPADLYAQAAREAMRAQIMAALQQRLGALPSAGADGRCEASDGEPRLQCDSDALAEALQADAAALASLLKAYRGADPRIAVAALAHTQGRYTLELR